MIIGSIKRTICNKCGQIKDKYVNIEQFYSNKSKCSCGGVLLEQDHSKNKSNKYENILVDKTLGYYDVQLDTYIGSTSHRRSVEKQVGVYALTSKEKVTDFQERVGETSGESQCFSGILKRV
jgi:hypothetical protein